MESADKNLLNWAIICPGLSLKTHSIFEHDMGCLIAVNGAILHTTSNYWAVTDEEVFSAVSEKIDLKALTDKVTLWIPKFWISNAHQRLPMIFHSFKRETWDWVDDGPPERFVLKSDTWALDIGKGFPWKEYTMFLAIALAIKKNAKTIRIYGASLKGTGYFTPGLENDRTRHIEGRWKDEIFWFNNICRACMNAGIPITWEGAECPR